MSPTIQMKQKWLRGAASRYKLRAGGKVQKTSRRRINGIKGKESYCNRGQLKATREGGQPTRLF